MRGEQGREGGEGILPRDVIALTTRPGEGGGRDGFERSGLNK